MLRVAHLISSHLMSFHLMRCECSSTSGLIATYELRTSERLNREERATEYLDIRCTEGGGQQEGIATAEVLYSNVQYSSRRRPALRPVFEFEKIYNFKI